VSSTDALGAAAIVVTVAIGVPTIIYAAIAARPARPHRLEYHLWRASTLLALPTRSSIQVKINGKIVTDAWQLTVRLVNSGKQPIRLEDWSSPISLKFPTDTGPISSTVSAVRPSSLSPMTRVVGDSVLIEPVLLNQGDLLELQIVGDGTGDYRRPIVEGRIANLPTFKRARFIYNPGNGPEGNFIKNDFVIWSVFAALGIGLELLLAFGVVNLDLAGKLWLGGAFGVVVFAFVPIWLWAANRRRAAWRPTTQLTEPVAEAEVPPSEEDTPAMTTTPLPPSGVKPRWRVLLVPDQPGRLMLANLASEKSRPQNVRMEASPAAFQFASAAEWDVVIGGGQGLFSGSATDGGRQFGVDFEVHWFDDEGVEWNQEVTLSPQRGF
jgi:hypothetical protein